MKILELLLLVQGIQRLSQLLVSNVTNLVEIYHIHRYFKLVQDLFGDIYTTIDSKSIKKTCLQKKSSHFITSKQYGITLYALNQEFKVTKHT